MDRYELIARYCDFQWKLTGREDLAEHPEEIDEVELRIFEKALEDLKKKGKKIKLGQMASYMDKLRLQIFQEHLREDAFGKAMEDSLESAVQSLRKRYFNILKKNILNVPTRRTYRGRGAEGGRSSAAHLAAGIETYLDDLLRDYRRIDILISPREQLGLIVDAVAKNARAAKLFRDLNHNEREAVKQKVISSGFADRCRMKLYETTKREEVLEAILANPLYIKASSQARSREKSRARVNQSIITAMPDRYIDLFPAARKIHRHFVLHVGPTNSGKTYSALEAMKKAETGIYLAPLRLLAFEKYDGLNKEGYPTNLLTGEESAIVENARYQASTIEMLDVTRHYHCAVIDEAQMIADISRGGSWTAAILGVLAEEVHVCMAPDAEQLVCDLITSCGDDFEVERHERAVPLLFEKGEFRFPDSVRKHDALIVFSKRSVLAVAAVLQEKGISCSVIYGALPYNVRHMEAERFSTGDTDVVVATDAIGMGLNLPAERVVFLESEKFDGVSKRGLTASEVQQIAGRAGRRGMYETGYCNALTEKDYIRKAFFEKVGSLRVAVLGFPRTLLTIDAKVSEILSRWNSLPAQEGFWKEDSAVQIALARQLEAYTDDRELIYQFVTIPFEEDNEVLKSLWLRLFMVEIGKEPYEPEELAPRIFATGQTEKDLNRLEEAYKECDLLYNYLRRFGYEEDMEKVLTFKMDIAERIIELLKKQKLPGKRCSACGRALPWDFPYRICERCRERRFRTWH